MENPNNRKRPEVGKIYSLHSVKGEHPLVLSTSAPIKKCPKCKKLKLLTEFYFRFPKKQIRQSHCKKCVLKYAKVHWRNMLPWKKTYHYIMDRIKRADTYKERNIKNYLSITDLKFLWFRDKANLMKKPSIDRKNNDGHYIIMNCRFIEMRENSRLGGSLRLS